MTLSPRTVLCLTIFLAVLFLSIPSTDAKKKSKGNSENEPMPNTATNQLPEGVDIPELKLNYYDLLKVPRGATQGEIRRAYIRAAATNHPDKFREPAQKLIQEAKFTRIGAAYEVLKDDNKRMLYHSMLERGMVDFDDEKYFDTFKPKRTDEDGNEIDEPAPEVTMWQIPYVESMSDHTVLLICVPFVALFMGIPLYQSYKAPRRKTKKETKQAVLANISHKKKLEDRRKLEEVRLKQAIAEMSDEEDEEEPTSKEDRVDAALVKQREAKKAEQTKQKRYRAILKVVVKPFTEGFNGPKASPRADQKLSENEVELLSRNLSAQELESLVNSVTKALGRMEYMDEDVVSTPEQLRSAFALFRTALAKLESSRAEYEAKQAAKLAERKALLKKTEDELKNRPPWSHQELSQLAKGMAKYPGGTPGRWTRVTELVNMVGKRTEKEVLAKARENEILASLKKTDEKAYEIYLARMGKHAQAHAAANNAGTSEAPKKVKASPSPTPSPVPATEEAPKKSASPAPAPAPAAAPAAAPSSSSSSSEPSEGDWTPAQQAALEAALKAVRGTNATTEDRWTVIARGVPGKNREQCMLRFQSIRDSLKAAQK